MPAARRSASSSCACSAPLPASACWRRSRPAPGRSPCSTAARSPAPTASRSTRTSSPPSPKPPPTAAVTVLNGTCTITPSKAAPITYTTAPDTATTDPASLTIYAYGDLAISGNGALVGGKIPGANIGADPTKLQIYGLAPSSQSFDIGGNGNLAAAIYAPHANIKFNGGGSSGYFAGATVANNITVNGNGYRIRYPEEMSNDSSSNVYTISRWLELTDRSTWHNFAAN